MLLSDGFVIGRPEVERLLEQSVRPARELDPGAPASATPLVREYRHLHSHSAEQLREALRRHGGNQSRAAQSLGLTLRQFSYRWHRLGDSAADS